MTEQAQTLRSKLAAKQKAAAVDRREAAAIQKAAQTLEEYAVLLSAQAIRADDDSFSVLSARFQEQVQAMEQQFAAASAKLEHTFAFLETTFGKGQELVVFVTELNINSFAMWFIGQNGSASYTRCNKELMIGKQRQDLLQDIGKIQSFLTVL